MNKLSEHQLRVIDHLQKHGGELYRIPGGFWVTSDVILRPGRVPAQGEFYTEIRTVRALERKGYLERLNLCCEEWRDTRKLVQAAVDARIAQEDAEGEARWNKGVNRILKSL